MYMSKFYTLYRTKNIYVILNKSVSQDDLCPMLHLASDINL